MAGEEQEQRQLLGRPRCQLIYPISPAWDLVVGPVLLVFVPRAIVPVFAPFVGHSLARPSPSHVA
ncbi:hypothetical protein LX32DRAFT_641710 [Colletotrichum zoysiae]|uniref:Uncharacterized protein n=1 Tax=Colletotrichum zoysiae TaxID=1216348 RepID=A0AAD9M2M8_9PEZI|nr:hypothetical protein LX32DRAFT_641710 [Colletotrichum zoysiae]